MFNGLECAECEAHKIVNKFQNNNPLGILIYTAFKKPYDKHLIYVYNLVCICILQADNKKKGHFYLFENTFLIHLI